MTPPRPEYSAITPKGHKFTVSIGPLIGAGSHASCHLASNGQVAKIYRGRIRAGAPERRLRAKLNAMAAQGPPQCDAAHIARPTAILANSGTGIIAGYLMPALPPDFQPLLHPQNPTPAPAWATAIDHAGQALEQLHRQKIVIGDINGANLQCNAAGDLALLYCDGWQIRHNGSIYPAQGATRRYTSGNLLAQYQSAMPCVSKDSPAYGTVHNANIGCHPRQPRRDRYALDALRRHAAWLALRRVK